jgi:hypothetical protein
MKFFGIFAPGQERDKDLSARVENVLKEYGDRVLFSSKEECIKTADKIKSQLAITGLKLEWLNGWDNEQQESVVFCVSRSVTIPYAIGYLHFYKSRN